MTRTNSLTGSAGWLRHATASSPFLNRLNIHRRLTLCFIFIIVLMLIGNGVLLWQLHLISAQVERLNGVNEELIEVLRVHTGLLSAYERLGAAAQSEDSRRLLKESETLRAGLVEDAQRTQTAFSHLPPEVNADQTVLPTLESIERALPSHLDAIRALTASGEWEAVRIRIEVQVQPLESLSSELVKDVAREVEEQRAQATLNISRAERRIFLAVPITGFVTLLIAAGLGVAITRSITEPLGRLVEGSKALARGEFQHQVSEIGQDELAQLGQVFNATAGRLQNLYENLRKSEANLAEAQRLSHTGSWDWDVASKRIFWSAEMFNIFGFDTKNTTPTPENYLQSIHPDDRAHIAAAASELYKGNDADYNYRIVLPDNSIRYVRTIAHAITNDSGQVIEFVGTVMDVTERKRAEEKLRGREADLLEAQRISQTGSWKLVALSGKVMVSPQIFQIFGVEPDEDTSTPEFWLSRNHPEDQKRIRELFERSRIQKTDYDADYRIVLPDGSIKHLHAVGHPVLNESGDLVEFVGTAMDITDRKHREEALLRSESYLAEAQKLTHTGSWAVRVPQMENAQCEAGRSLAVIPRNGWAASYWSKEMYRIFSFDPGPAPPSFREVVLRFHPEDARNNTPVVEKAIRDRTDFEIDYRLILPNAPAKYIHVVGHPVVSASGDVIELVGTAMDVTERKQAEERIREQEVELRQILDAAPQHLSVLKSDGSHLYINQSSLDFLGLTLEEWQKCDIRELVHPDDAERVARERSQALSTGSTLKIEARFLRYDREYRWLFLYYKPLRDQLGRITRWVVPAIDIDDRKRSEERLHHENVALREEIVKASMFEEIVGTSQPLQTVLSSIVKVAPTDSTVLITGETGTGKELVARAIHKHSQRSGQAFISVNCASIPSSLIASELFGHEKGAFTGAAQRRQGRFELAHSGTIFLDEVGELPAETQIALLRVLQERQFERVGGNRTLSTDVRVIAATNRDLTAAIAAGTFRSDLFYRLNVFPIEVPPLRKRREDIPVLVEYFVKRYAEKAGKRICRIDNNTIELCQAYSWPGNIRELQNIVERSVILSSGDTFWIEETWLTSPLTARQESQVPLPETLQNQEREIIQAALAECKGKVAGPRGAAAKLGIPRSTLDGKIKQLKIKKHKFISE